jgi:hypothetical protein
MADLPTSKPLAAPKPKGGPTLTEDEVSAWRSRLSASRDVIKPIIERGKKNIARLVNQSLEMTPATDTITVPLDFAYTYQKAALLFPETPEIIGEALHPAFEQAVPIYTAVANHALGPRGVNAMAMIEEISTDLLCAVGYGVTKIGYENVIDGTKDVPTGQQIPDPNAPPPMPVEQPGAILGLSQPPAPAPAMIPETMPVPNVISETYYWRRIPPGRLRCPRDFRGSDFDDAAWLAWRFEEDVPDGDEPTRTKRGRTNDDEMLLSTPPDTTDAPAAKKRSGEEVWYKASLFDKDAKHPDLMRTFKLYDDEDRPPARRDSPNQRWALPNQPLSETYVPGGTLVGMKGHPIHIFTLRYVSDRALPPSDSTMARQIIDEISKGRTQLLQRRDRNMPQVGFDSTSVTPEQLAKIERNENTGFIAFSGPLADGTFKEINKGQLGRENFAFNDIAQRDLDMIYAMGSNAGVMKGDSPETATKSNQIQQAIQSRARKEFARMEGTFAKGVEKLMGLYQIYADQEDYVRIVGPDGAKRLVAWNKDSLAGPFALKAKPNPQAHMDANARGQQLLQGYNQLRKDPNVEPRELVKPLAAHMGYDPERLWKDSPPPEPEKPSVSYAMKIEDFVGPGAGVAAHLSALAGWPIPPQILQTAQTLGAIVAAQEQAAAQQAEAQKQQAKGSRPGNEHGGQAEQSEPINKHQMDLTGGMQGVEPPGPVM